MKNPSCKYLIGILGWGLSCVLMAGVLLKSGHPTRYEVKPGDTLWSISNQFLQKPWDWAELWVNYKNENAINHLFPGDVLELKEGPSGPHLELVKGGTVKISPHLRSNNLENTITAIPVEFVQPFLNDSRVISPAEMKAAPYVLQPKGEHLGVGSFEQIYVRGLKNSTMTRYSILRPGNPYKEMDGKTLLGYEATHVGEAVLQRSGEPALFWVQEAKDPVMVGDRLFPHIDALTQLDFYPRTPKMKISAQIISVFGGVTQIGSYQVVVVNQGALKGLQPGDVLSVYQLGEKYNTDDLLERKSLKNRRWRRIRVKVPDELVGEMIIFRTFAKVSYGLILNTQGPVHTGDWALNPNGLV